MPSSACDAAGRAEAVDCTVNVVSPSSSAKTTMVRPTSYGEPLASGTAAVVKTSRSAFTISWNAPVMG